jgi:hypothetical protein
MNTTRHLSLMNNKLSYTPAKLEPSSWNHPWEDNFSGASWWSLGNQADFQMLTSVDNHTEGGVQDKTAIDLTAELQNEYSKHKCTSTIVVSCRQYKNCRFQNTKTTLCK